MEIISYIGEMKQTQYLNYFVNEQGDVFSTKHGSIKRLKSGNHPQGYLLISICNNGNSKNILVHRLIAQTFIPNAENKPEVNHKNGIKWDNRVENLEWVTKSENMSHAKSTGLFNNGGENHYNTKLTKEQIIQIRELYATKKYTQKQLGKMFGIKTRTISDIINKKSWNHI